MTNMPAWTYSQLGGYETCPRQYLHLKVLRDVKEPPTVHTEWGHKVHSAFEAATLTGAPLPDGMTQWQALADKYNALPGEKLPEYKFAIDRNFQPADWGAAWSRGIADLVVINGTSALIADWKTGKRKPTEQLDLYAAYVSHHFPQVTTVHTHFVWLKEKKIDRKKIEVADIPVVWQKMLPRVRRLESAYERDAWPARPSGLCRGWCAVLSCVHNGRKQ